MALPISYNVRSLFVRWQVTLLSIFGIALVVAVLVVLLAMVAGVQLALRSTGLRENAMIVQRGSSGELTSWIPLAHRRLIVVDPRVARGPDGQPLASPEIVIISNKPRRADGRPTNVIIRGVSARAFQVRGGIEIVQGRNFTPGLREVVVGERIAERIKDLDLGGVITLQRKDWRIVGVFRSRGGAFESEIWGDLDVMGPAFNRSGGSSVLVVRMNDPAAIPDLDNTLRADPQMEVEAREEQKYYGDQAGPVSSALIGLAVFVAVVMGIGAVFGAMNTMYAIVAARTREIATLRALGFSRRSVLLSFVAESVFLALVGGAVGVLLAVPANGFTTATGNVSFSELAFAFHITPRAIAIGIAFAAIMGLVGGLLPAGRAARLPIPSALREA
jgi:putative ABC transport system permease protein